MSDFAPITRHLGEIRLDPRQFIEMYMEGYESHCWRVLADGLLSDVKVRLLAFDPALAVVRVIVEHPSFPEMPPDSEIPLLPPPQIAVGHDDHEHAPRAAFAEY
jgi:hypothetical protein